MQHRKDGRTLKGASIVVNIRSTAHTGYVPLTIQAVYLLSGGERSLVYSCRRRTHNEGVLKIARLPCGVWEEAAALATASPFVRLSP